ncbi:MAG: hypothetical protein KKA73_17285 [Chloroflexi bacterium]|nr:hypothetical protein [Chloroflexota bacterium]MBU1749440.1 hypothetical protein [Chloroflexota bacterium]MBU1878670.1 hypothetical protein [Chloroflexota bacterium]
MFLIGTTLGALVGFAVGLVVAWQIWLKVLRWLWARVQRVTGRAPAQGDEFDFQMLVQ